jgi:hypothetical protein
VISRERVAFATTRARPLQIDEISRRIADATRVAVDDGLNRCVGEGDVVLRARLRPPSGRELARFRSSRAVTGSQHFRRGAPGNRAARWLADEHHVRQALLDVEVVIEERGSVRGRALRGARTGRCGTIDLVDFVEQEDRVIELTFSSSG